MAEDAGRGTTPASRYTITAAVIFLLLLPGIVMASTPPVQPSLVLTISSSGAGPDMPLTVSVSWHGFSIPFHVPPESITIDAYSLPDGTRVATFPVPRTDIACSPDETCTYQRTIPATGLPSGDLMLIATDPLSAAFDRHVIRYPGMAQAPLDSGQGLHRNRHFSEFRLGLPSSSPAYSCISSAEEPEETGFGLKSGV